MLSRLHPSVVLAISLALAVSLSACSGNASLSTSSAPTANTLTLSLGLSAATVASDGTTSMVGVNVARSMGNNSVTLSLAGAPTGLTVAYIQPLLGVYGALTFSNSGGAAASGVYTVTVTATDGTLSSSSTLQLTVNALDAITITPASTTLLARQDTTPVSEAFTVTRTYGNVKAITVSASGLPTGLTASFTQPGTGTTGAVTLTSSATPAAAGSYTVTLTATDGTASGTSVIGVTLGVVATIANTTNTSQGIAGALQEYMSTGFQPSIYDDPFLKTFPSLTDLSALQSEHIRIQVNSTDTPQVANSTPQAATDWNFTGADATVQPILTVGDQSPIYQIQVAPSFLDDANGHFIFNSTNLALLTTYAQNLVRYYNTGGFTWGGKHFQSASSTHITWWAIFNEPNLNNVTAAQYVQMYNTLVPAMLSVDPTLKFVALELSDYTAQPQAYLPTLVLPAASGGLSAQVNAFATHFYGSCNQLTTDAAVLAKVPTFATDITYFHTELNMRSDLAGVPVWVTENNVNSDYGLTTGLSNCNTGQKFVADSRGTSGFFTAWRPYEFSQLGKAGSESLYHFLYEGSVQYGEVNSGSAAKTLAYWTDYELERIFPWNGVTTGSSILTTTSSEKTPTVEVLAVRNTDNSVSLMVTDYAVVASTDDNGIGAARTVLVDISALGSFSSGSQINLNASTSVTTGPTSTAITPTSVMTVNLSGYGTAFFVLKP